MTRQQLVGRFRQVIAGCLEPPQILLDQMQSAVQFVTVQTRRVGV